MTLKITILGCGSSGGVPRLGNIWGECDPDNPRNRRRRCSILVEKWAGNEAGGGERTSLLVDTSPDMRAQLLDTGTAWLDGVVYTHEHADHIHGIDDLRMIAFNGKRPVDVYMSPAAAEIIMMRFAYCFHTPEGSPYPSILDQHMLEAGRILRIDGPGGIIETLPFEQQHGHIHSLGFRFGNIAYSCDLNNLPEKSLPALEGLDVWIVDALRRTPHPSHFSLDDALAWIEQIGPKQAILTNLHIDLDYDTLCRELPDHVRPAHDGLAIETVDGLPEPIGG